MLKTLFKALLVGFIGFVVLFKVADGGAHSGNWKKAHEVHVSNAIDGFRSHVEYKGD